MGRKGDEKLGAKSLQESGRIACVVRIGVAWAVFGGADG